MLVSLTHIEVPPEDQVTHREDNTSAYVSDTNPLGKGSLIIAQNSYSSSDDLNVDTLVLRSAYHIKWLRTGIPYQC
ncbi:unnamed protein product [Oppiella nova]|uniref:Uncharacterized protein n=1 Tax=Oppiella nova TaxID=334625 RepID=A0A7R9QBP9_9ACAR|nr:unnamed protein product [Oppiella nova]CAG2162514.1 unnamed protein product [Oppiella nova]